MNERVEVVMIKGDDGKPTRINATDYDKSKHGKLLTEQDVQEMQPPQTTGTLEGTQGQRIPGTEQRVALQPPEIPAGGHPGTPNVITDGHTPTNADGTGAPGAPLATAPGPQYAVVKEGKKFFVANLATGAHITDQDGIDKEGYGKEADAWNAILALPKPDATPVAPAAPPAA